MYKIRIFFVIVFSIYCAIFSLAQSSTTDSLVFDISVIDTTLINKINQYAFDIKESVPLTSLSYVHKTLELSEILNYELGMANALSTMAWINYRKSNFLKALELANKSYDISSEISAKSEMFLSGTIIGSVYNSQKKYDKSISQIKQMLELSRELDKPKFISRTMGNLAYNYIVSEHSIDSALLYAQQGFQIAKEINDSYLIAYNLRSIGDVYRVSGEFDNAIITYKEAIQYADLAESHTTISHISRRLASAYLQTENISNSKYYVQLAIDEASINGSLLELALAYELLTKINIHDNDYIKAYANRLKYETYRDSTDHISEVSLFKYLEFEYESKLEKAENEILNHHITIQQEKIKGQNLIIALVLIAVIMLLLFSIILFLARKKEIKHSEELTKLNEKINTINNNKDQLFRIVAHDLRGPIGGLSKALIILKQFAQEENIAKTIELSGLLEGQSKTTYDTLENLLQWSQSQNNALEAQIENNDLRASIEDTIALLEYKAIQKSINLIPQIPEKCIAKYDDHMIDSVLRNLISNAIKFSPENDNVLIKVNADLDDWVIEVVNTGIVMNQDKINKLLDSGSFNSTAGTNNEQGSGIGLNLCINFLNKNGSSLEVSSNSNDGNTFHFRLQKAL